MGWFRSEEMEYVCLVIQEEAAHDLIDEIGERGCMQFTDLNHDQTAFQRRYASYIRRCDEIERKLRYVEATAKNYMPLAWPPKEKPGWDSVKEYFPRYREKGAAHLIESMESDFEKYEQELQTLIKYRTQLREECNKNLELKAVLHEASAFFKDGKNNQLAASGSDIEKSDIAFSYITGTVETSQESEMERIIFRTTRGNALIRFQQIATPFSCVRSGKEEDVMKSVFIIFYRSSSIQHKIVKICDVFHATRFDVPNLGDDRLVVTKTREVSSDIADAENILTRNTTMLHEKLSFVLPQLFLFQNLITKEKSVFHTMNMFKVVKKMGSGGESKTSGGAVLRGEGWVVKSVKEDLARIVRGRSDSDHVGVISDVNESRWPKAPTYFKLNKLTSSYQGLVSTYGVPRYREANPALFACASFPFLFGVMYGDVGHATLLFIFSVLMVKYEKYLKKNLDELTGMIFGGRYLMVGMAFMAIYCGFIYNDYFSIGLNLFGSRWALPPPTSLDRKATRIGDVTNVYPIGVDTAWHIAENSLMFTNSLKMKMAIIFGVSQMLLGFFLKLSNAIYFKRPLDVWFEAVPQIVMFTALYGYSCFLIIYKWCIDWPARMAIHQTPPDLITMLINLVLSPGNVTDPMFEGQAQLQLYIIYLSLICILLMLFPKPIILYQQHKEAQEKKKLDDDHGHHHDDDDEGGAHDEHEDFTDVVVHIGIETIEFILGSVSNTASYLRLWALSLAHAQLAEVFLVQFFVPGINMGVVGTIIGYAVWACATLVVLLMMDVLECFLHALRLHWVEFQNKFYKADGYEFQPLDFKKMLVAADFLEDDD